MISYPPESSHSPLLQAALYNHALEARKRRGRREQHKSLELLTGHSSTSKSTGLRSSLEVEDRDYGLVLEEEGGSRLFSSGNASDLRRHQHVRRKRQFNPPSPATPVIASAPAQLSHIRHLPPVAPLRIQVKGASRHARSQSAPAVTPVDSPHDSILSFYLHEPDGDSDSDTGSVCSAPPSTTDETSMNMFLVRGDSIDSWPTEFPVEALEEQYEFEGGDVGELGLKRQNTEAVVKLLRARRRRAGAGSMDSQMTSDSWF